MFSCFVSVLALNIIHHSISSKISIEIDYTYDQPSYDENRALDDRWTQFLETYNKIYSENEMSVRRAIFRETEKLITDHNLKFLNGEASFLLGINYYADMTKLEISELYKGYQNLRRHSGNKLLQHFDEQSHLPAAVNWKNKGIVTPIKNQGHCGSCYAFSAVGSLEGQYALKYNKLKSFSEQNIVDCSQSYGNQGCDGGLMDDVFKYIESNGGIDTEDEYPYQGNVGTCRYIKDTLNVTEYRDVKEGSESQLQQAVANVGPIAVGIDASSLFFQFYRSGVYDHPGCSTTQLDHGVLVVGYGVENGHDFWLVKNSWGTNWGEDGYIKMSRGKNNQCGIATSASYPVL